MRDRLLAGAVEALLADPGAEATTIASLCRRANCTPPTLYHYWPDKGDLLSEAAGLVWAQFRSAVSPTHPDPTARVAARGHAYLDFALTRENAFRLLFLAPPGGPTRVAADADTPGEGLQDLIVDIAAMLHKRGGQTDPNKLAMMLWAYVHGVATLWAGHDGLAPRDAHDLLDAGLATMLSGMA
jgi:AcrR family transcriptional regulator